LIARRPRLKAFLDAGIPDSVGAMLTHHGHEVIYYRDVLPEKTADDIVCATALANEAILVAMDGDMKQFPKRFGISQNSSRFDKLNLIRLCCNEVLAAKRLDQAMSLIEHEWTFSDEKSSRRLWIEIGTHHLRSNR
jgi:predicted nuclease of predicted toxin-antitoxin system